MSDEELTLQIESMVEDYCSTFMDVYQCTDWGITAQQFAASLIKRFSAMVQEYATELDNGE